MMGENESGVLGVAVGSGAGKAAELGAECALNGLVTFVKDKYGKAQVLTQSVFQRYLKNAYERFNKVKTLATGNDARAIVGKDSVYVNVGVKYNGREVDTSTVDHLLRVGNNILILGTGGAGKSMLMRYLFLNTVDRGSYVPLLLELRKLGGADHSNLSILDLAYAGMQSFDVALPREQLEYSLRHGGYLFLLDGFDEVRDEVADQVAANIQEFSAKYPKNIYIVTSRPGQKFSGLETFAETKSLMMNLEQAVTLASKLWERDEKAIEFCRQLREGLFEQHKDFAENPLLLTIMLLTFMRNNSIPDHLADFYEKAYEALYSAHDNWSKGVYRREFKCKKLDEGQFKAILAHFCFQTYFAEEYEFSKDEILERLAASIKKMGAEATAEGCLYDLRRAVCLVVEDGGTYHFAHRSFQEYFAAFYVARFIPDIQQKEFFYAYLSRREHLGETRFFEVLFQLEPERFGANVLEQQLRELRIKLEAEDDPDTFFLKELFSEVSVHIIGSSRVAGLQGVYVLVKNTAIHNVVNLFSAIYLEPSESDFFEERKEESAELVGYLRGFKESLVDDDEFSIRFSDIDNPEMWSDQVRREFYQRLAHYRRVRELCKDIYDWLDKLEAERSLAGKGDSFLDRLRAL